MKYEEMKTMARMSRHTRILVRYALFQIPGLAVLALVLILVQHWVDLPGWFLWGAIALWLAKDMALFPFVWQAYDRDLSRELRSLVGVQGIVEERLAPSGYIRVHGELWQAEIMNNGPPIEKGERVKIRQIEGLKLRVERP